MFYFIFSIILKVLIWLDFIFFSVVAYLLTWLPKFMTQTWYPAFFRFWCQAFVRAIGVDLKLHQKNEFPLPNHYILISNHPSALEDIGMPTLFSAKFLAKYEVQNWWIFGRISTAAGTFYVKREEKASRNEAALALESALNAGVSVGLYPEGGCKGRRIHLPFQYGCFDISLKTKTPILPVLIHYEAQADFEWAGETLVQKIITMTRSFNKTANYYVFDAINPDQFSSKEEYTAHVEKLYLSWQEKYLK